MRGQKPGPAQDAPAALPAPVVSGEVTVRRAHLIRYPAYVASTSGLEVGLGRFSALNIYFFGPGQKIILPGGIEWRLTAIPFGPSLAAVVINERRQRLAMASAGAVAGKYGINGRDYAYTLDPAEGGLGRASAWHLCCGEQIIAGFRRRPFGATCTSPVPLPAVLLTLLLARFGIPGENEVRIPKLNWGGQK
jgi:hypothetical protein